MERVLSRATDALSVSRAFGAPMERDGVLVIPVAFVAGGGGGGASEAPEAGEKGEKGEDAAGNGGGFGGVTWPLGVYVVAQGKVRWVPAVDVTRILLGVLAAARAATKVRAIRRRSAA